MTNPERIALIDMDGTVADYEGAIGPAFDRLCEPSFASYDILSNRYGRDQWPDYLWNRIDLIKRQPEFWRNLKPLDIGFEIIRVLREYGFQLHIATQGPSSKALAWAEKLEWARQWLPDASVHITENKSLLYGKILVDDWPPFAEAWLAHRPRGLVVMPAAHYNTDVQHPQIIRYSPGMEKELSQRIEAII